LATVAVIVVVAVHRSPLTGVGVTPTALRGAAVSPPPPSADDADEGTAAGVGGVGGVGETVSPGSAARSSCMAREQCFGRTSGSPPPPVPVAAHVPNAEQTSARVRPTPARFADRYSNAEPSDAY
jgi:hypothetical protein